MSLFSSLVLSTSSVSFSDDSSVSSGLEANSTNKSEISGIVFDNSIIKYNIPATAPTFNQCEHICNILFTNANTLGILAMSFFNDLNSKFK